MDPNVKMAINATVRYFEKIYVLEYYGDRCCSKRDELDYYLSLGATVKHLHVVRLDDTKTIHSIVIRIHPTVIAKAPFNP